MGIKGGPPWLGLPPEGMSTGPSGIIPLGFGPICPGGGGGPEKRGGGPPCGAPEGPEGTAAPGP